MECIIKLNDCEILGSGCEGSVYLTPEGYALKVFTSIKSAESEAEILKKTESSRFFPNLLLKVSNIVIRDCVHGETLYEYLKIKGLSFKTSTEIIDLIEDLKRLKFKRINIRNAHIFIDNNENIMVIDPRKSYDKLTPYPKDIIKVLLKLNLFDDFIKNVVIYKPELLSYWIDGYNYVVNMYRHVLRYKC